MNGEKVFTCSTDQASTPQISTLCSYGPSATIQLFSPPQDLEIYVPHSRDFRHLCRQYHHTEQYVWPQRFLVDDQRIYPGCQLREHGADIFAMIYLHPQAMLPVCWNWYMCYMANRALKVR